MAIVRVQERHRGKDTPTLWVKSVIRSYVYQAKRSMLELCRFIHQAWGVRYIKGCQVLVQIVARRHFPVISSCYWDPVSLSYAYSPAASTPSALVIHQDRVMRLHRFQAGSKSLALQATPQTPIGQLRHSLPNLFQPGAVLSASLTVVLEMLESAAGSMICCVSTKRQRRFDCIAVHLLLEAASGVLPSWSSFPSRCVRWE